MIDPFPPFPAAVVRQVVALLVAIRPEDVALDPAVPAESLFHVARYCQVAPALWLALRHHPDCSDLLRREMQQDYLQNFRRNAVHRHVLREISRRLEKRRLRILVLKGGCQLLDPVNGHPGRRVMTDLDLLAAPGEAAQVAEEVLAEGFEPEDRIEPYEIHGPKLHRPSDGACVEVHHIPWPGAGGPEVAALFRDSVPSGDDEIPVRMPCVRHRLLHNAIHAGHQDVMQLHGKAGTVLARLSRAGLAPLMNRWSDAEIELLIGSTELRQVLDFHELCIHRSAHLDWETILAEARTFNRLPDIQQWAWTCRQVFGTPVPDAAAVCRAPRPGVRLGYYRLRDGIATLRPPQHGSHGAPG